MDLNEVINLYQRIIINSVSIKRIQSVYDRYFESIRAEDFILQIHKEVGIEIKNTNSTVRDFKSIPEL